MKAGAARRLGRTPATQGCGSAPAQIMALERRRTDALTRRKVDRVRHRRRHRRTGGLTETAPFLAARQCEMDLDVRHLIHAQQVIAVKVSIDESPVLQLQSA